MKHDLTPRESEVLELIAKGYGNKAIMDILSISRGTLLTHLQNLYLKSFIYDGTQQDKKAKRVRLALYYLKQNKEVLDDIKLDDIKLDDIKLDDIKLDDIKCITAGNNRLKMELATRNQMLMDAHFQNKKLADELVITQNQYNKVVEQNKSYNMRNMELEKRFKTVLNIAKTHDMPSCLDADCSCDICHDEITEYGKRCMQKGIRDILKVLEEI